MKANVPLKISLRILRSAKSTRKQGFGQLLPVLLLSALRVQPQATNPSFFFRMSRKNHSCFS